MAPTPKYKPILHLLIIALLTFIFGFLSLIPLLIQLVRKGPRRLFSVKERNVRPEILEGSQYGTHEFMRLKNSRMKLHYVVNGSKDKPLMLFLHGFPQIWFSWRRQMAEFSKDFRVVAVDMRGYGESDKPQGISDYYIEILTDDVKELISGLGYEKCTLVSHDWGGAVAWMFASLHPEMVEKLVVCNCPHPAAFEDHAQSAISQILKSWYMFFFQLPYLPILHMRMDDMRNFELAFVGKKMGAKRGSFTEEDMEVYKYALNRYEDFVGPINYYRAMMRYTVPNVRKTKIIPPTLLIWGTNDAALEKAMADLTERYVEDFTLRLVEGASHWVNEEEPEQVNGHIRQFLSVKK